MGLFDKIFGVRKALSSSLSQKGLSVEGQAEFISPTDGSIVRAEHTAWTSVSYPHREIVRVYEFRGLSTPHTYRRVEVRCRQTRPVGGLLPKPLIYFVVSPRMGEGGGFLAATFEPHDALPPKKSIVLRVEATDNENQIYVLHDYTDYCLTVLLFGKPIAVQFISQAGVFASFLLENDRSFGDGYATLTDF
ncbi:MAG: hypothetical protein WA418_20515 [Bradyrhizobium sp.]